MNYVTKGRCVHAFHAATGVADLVCVVRPLIADPEWTNKALSGNRERIRECISCNVGCRGGPHRGTTIACLVNPAVGYERTMGIGTLQRTTSPRHVVVIGGGPGGLTAAETAALRGQLASWQVAGLAEVNRPGVAHSGWSMNGLRLPWKL